MSDLRKPTPDQLALALPGPTTHLTGHDNSTGKTCFHSERPVNWTKFDNDNLNMSVAYTTSFPADLVEDADISVHEAKLASGKLGLISSGGTVLRYCDFAPAYQTTMHRTQSIDYGIVVEGEVDCVLDSGEERRLRRGDVLVQRATMHAWRNPSKTEWCRMIFVLQDCKPVFVGGHRLGEDIGRGNEELPNSGNDVRCVAGFMLPATTPSMRMG